MTTVIDYINNLNSIDVESIIIQIIKDREEDITDLNREQLDDGEDYEGLIVGKYTKNTEKIAKLEKPNKPKIAGKPYNFDWTGKLTSGIFTKYKDGVLYFDSKGKGKGEKKLFVDTKRLLGVNDENADIINYFIILPSLQKEINKILG